MIKGQVINARCMPPIIDLDGKVRKIRVIDTITLEFPITTRKGVFLIDMWAVGHAGLDYTIFTSILAKRIREHKDMKEIKLKKNQFLTMTCMRIYKDLKMAEVDVDIVERVK